MKKKKKKSADEKIWKRVSNRTKKKEGVHKRQAKGNTKGIRK